MKTFYYYENSRKRYSASYSAGEKIFYTVDYRVQQINFFGNRLFKWVTVASLSSMKKFHDIKEMLDIKVYDDHRIKSEARRAYTNPFLEYQGNLLSKPVVQSGRTIKLSYDKVKKSK